MDNFDIFEAPVSTISDGLEGKVILIYGHNNLGKTAQAARFPKPFIIAAEMGLNGISGVRYRPVTNWSGFVKIIKQFTDKKTKAKAKEMYSTIVIDEVYATALYCQDYVCSTFGNGVKTLSEGNGNKEVKTNLYEAYEKEYFRQINLLVSAGYTVVFIAHEKVDSKTGFISPKGDKRNIDPIIDKCDYVIYLKSNGVDENNRVIKSSAYLAQTSEFFARSRIEYTPTYIPEFTAENLTKAIQEGINKKQALEGAIVTSFEEQQETRKDTKLDFEELIKTFNELIQSIPGSSDVQGITPEGIEFQKVWGPKIVSITDKYLGVGKKVSQCNEYQVEAIALIVDELKAMLN